MLAAESAGDSPLSARWPAAVAAAEVAALQQVQQLWQACCRQPQPRPSQANSQQRAAQALAADAPAAAESHQEPSTELEAAWRLRRRPGGLKRSLKRSHAMWPLSQYLSELGSAAKKPVKVAA